MYEPTSATRVAVECLTLWMETGDEARAHAAEHVARVMHGPDALGFAAGLLNLNMIVLFQLVEDRGATADNTYQKAGDYLRALSRQLPEE